MRKNSKKNIIIYSIAILSILLLSACTTKKELPVVQITLWSDEQNIELIKSQLEEFKELHSDEAVFEFKIYVEGADTCRETVLTNPQAAADIYVFADDQFEDLYRNGALLEVTANPDNVYAGVGGEESGAAQAVTRDGRLYGYPYTAGNGYFLYYNKAYFTEDDVKTLDRILEVAAENNKKFAMDYSSGWYIYSFFKGAGLEVYSNEEGTANICNWNATDTEYTGVQVAEAMVTVASSEGFDATNDDGFIEGVNNGEIIAGINGAWNAGIVENAWGDDYAATMLPTYTLAGNQVQMCSFTGYKIVGVNAYTDYPDYCMAIAEYLTNEECQIEHFELTGECPANAVAASDPAVQNSQAIAAFAMQSRYGYTQRVSESYWSASSKLGITLGSGNRDNRDYQELLDDTVEAITATAK